MYRPTTSRTLPVNCGSEGSFQVSSRCGFSPNARQIRDTAVWFRPAARAIDRVDQCVSRFGGLRSSVFTITSSACSSVIFRGCPGRGSSPSPSSPPGTNRAPPPPLAHHPLRHPEPGRDLLVRRSLRARQHDPRPQRQRLRALLPPRPPLQDGPLVFCQLQRRLRAPSSCHSSSLPNYS